MRERVRAAVRTRDPRAVFWAAFLAMAALGGVWAVSNPMAASPDEPSHIVRAVGIVRERSLGEEVRVGMRQVEVPRVYAATLEMPGCYAFRADQPASCSFVDLTTPAVDQPATTTADEGNPLYYAIVGLPSLLPPSLEAAYLMRIVSVLLSSALVAAGLRSLAEARLGGWAVLGAGVATTPMVVFMASTVNPNSVEATAAIGLWLTLLAALHRPRPELALRQWWRAGVLVVLLVNAKALSPLFLALVVLTVLVTVPWRRTAAVLADRRPWPGIVLGAVGSAAAVAWTAVNGAVSGGDVVNHPDLEWRGALEGALSLTTFYYEGMVGRFGWLDTRPPSWTYYWFTAVLGTVLAAAWAVARRRQRVVVAVLAVAVWLVPVALQVPNARYLGLPWQGRYLLAVAVGVPILAGLAVQARVTAIPRRVTRRVLVLGVTTLGVVHLAQLLANLRRYVAGTEAPWFEPVANPWYPPVPLPLVLVGAVVAVVAWSAVLGWFALGRTAPEATDEGLADVDGVVRAHDDGTTRPLDRASRPLDGSPATGKGAGAAPSGSVAGPSAAPRC
ncbi:DUF2142 domain-containing protein [Cellulomonas carbonis]|uniref:Glycosyltransferase RgtA/B/C/D-like domain-containing protein n=1 Tax=Cellulomonas carbonis T26 TaxID=947969 RepID=A0A0A0BMM9_9CELL|nr:DUF2142 domain-containing protein [Cellulomonas carbonis]KGM09170.1 hypothetical protein N868_03940 [Cellulomonas carbonis T26]GGC11405.1 hypothetical protein GCM10010972_25910 [Cellulomonas carbonis]